MTRPGEYRGPLGPDDGRDGDSEEAVQRMRRAISGATSREHGARDELEAAAIQLVEELRAENHPPEQMLLRIKELLADAGLRPSYATDDPMTMAANEASVYRDVIAWSIRYYYGGEG